MLGCALGRADASFANRGLHGRSVQPRAPGCNAGREYAVSAQTARPIRDAGWRAQPAGDLDDPGLNYHFNWFAPAVVTRVSPGPGQAGAQIRAGHQPRDRQWQRLFEAHHAADRTDAERCDAAPVPARCARDAAEFAGAPSAYSKIGFIEPGFLKACFSLDSSQIADISRGPLCARSLHQRGTWTFSRQSSKATFPDWQIPNCGRLNSPFGDLASSSSLAPLASFDRSWGGSIAGSSH